MDLVAAIMESEASGDLGRALAAGRRVVATGSVGSSTALLAGGLARALDRPVVLAVAHVDDADEHEDELSVAGVPVLRLPALELAPGESAAVAELYAERIAAVRTLAATPDLPRVVVAPIAALMQAAPEPARLDRLARTVTPGQALDPGELVAWLGAGGYRRVETVEEPGEFAVRGGIIDVVTPTSQAIRLDFFGDEIERITEIDLDTMGSDRRIDGAELITADPDRLDAGADGVSVLELVSDRAVAIVSETMELVEQGRGYYERVAHADSIFGPPAVLKVLEGRFHALAEINQFSVGKAEADVRIELPVEPLPPFERDAARAFVEAGELAQGRPVVVCCQNDAEAGRARELAGIHAPGADIRVERTYVHRGFGWGAPTGPVVVPYHELLHRFERRRRAGRIKHGRAMDTFIDVQVGDYVVHADHGIARFSGLMLRKNDRDEQEEFLTLEFAGTSRLHVPASNIDLVQKYIGGFKGKPPLSTLGGVKWKHQKARVAESVRDLASEMLRVRAAREHVPGIAYPPDTKWQTEFEAEFPYDETEDQLAALAEIKRDMSSPRPMDRLICGDVGFGKTELAIRAAFKACEFGKQVAVLVPTTVLAEQHERTFASRFADFPFRVESLSRFKTTKEVNDTLRDLRKGHVDVVIGTHRLLSKDVKFADLGVVIIDEEQRFGVEHKERLLQLRMTVDVLTLSATPIPRTLHMAMLGLRDISSLTTPPVDRRSIVTEVIPYNAQRIRRAIERELAREGQVYFVHNRVYNIDTVADDLQKLVPDARIVVGHGQMPPKELESIMLTFMRRQADVLVSTTIIESGIDIPTANTMVINDADRFGLADLHQLRGRVGRFKHRAYCYFLLPVDRTVNEVAQKRLKAIEQFSMLGAGFKIAMRDLEIRGAGNLLGAEQSGHIAAVGYEMFCRLLDQAVQQLKEGGDDPLVRHCTVEIGLAGHLPRAWIPSDQRRLEAYRRLATADTLEAVAQVERDLVSAYGDLPSAADRLVRLARVRVAAQGVGVRALAVRGPDVVLLTPDPEPAAERLRAGPGAVRIVPPELAQTKTRTTSGRPMAEVWFRPPDGYLDPDTLANVLPARLTGPRAARETTSA